ncbi:Ectonucleotide pyrophosphatase/phosphodiesterase member 6 [Mactra antiquata]
MFIGEEANKQLLVEKLIQKFIRENIARNIDVHLEVYWSSSESTANKHSSLYYVPGCDVNIDGILSRYCTPYDHHMTHEKEVWAIEDALKKLKSHRVDIAYILLWKVDEIGHLYGPNSAQVRDAVLEVDTHINDILDIIEDNQQNDVNVIIVSDHGMSTIDTLHKINISEALDMNDILEITEEGTQAYVWPKSGKEEEVYNKLKKFHPNMKVYHRDDILDRWFFKKHTRIPPIFITVDKGWYLAHPKSSDEVFKWYGNHGYDNNNQDMKGIFAAYGPDFKSNKTVAGFRMTDVYQLICKVTGIKPKPNNGTWSNVEHLLNDADLKDEL